MTSDRPDVVGTAVSSTGDASPATIDAPAALVPRRRANEYLLVGLLFLLASVVLVTINVDRAPGLSIFDEMTHADYAWRASHFQIPARGDSISQEVLQETSCHGFASPQPAIPACHSGPVSPLSYPAKGEDYNFGHPPVYYFISGMAGRLIGSVLGPHHFVTGTRLVGILWLTAAMMVLYLALRVFSVRRRVAFAAGVLLALCPSVLHASSTVNNDAAAALGGSLALYLLAQALVRQRANPWLSGAITLFIAGTKIINALPFIALAAGFIGIAVVNRRSVAYARRLLLSAGAVLLSILVVYEGWSLFQKHRGISDWVNPIAGLSGRPVRGLPIEEWASVLFGGFPPTSGYFLAPAVDGELINLWTSAVTLALGIASVALLLVYRRGDAVWTMGLILVLALLAYPEVIELQVYIDSKSYFPLVQPRYGMSLIPWCVAASALLANVRNFPRTYIGATAVGGLAVFATIAGLT